MQPKVHGKRVTVMIAALSAVVLAATLLMSLRASAAAAPSSESTGSHVAANAAIVGGSIEQVEFTAYNEEVVGPIVSGPATGFVGTWQIMDSGSVVTVVVTADTALRGFAGNVPPARKAWVEAKVKRQPDGTLLAVKFRPNRFQSGEIVARLVPTVTLAQVMNAYRPYRLTPVESLLSSGRIYRFAISRGLDEAGVAAVLNADKANFVWAEVNFVSEVPVGNPYRTWKWGSGDETGYINQTALEQVDLPPVQGVYSGTNVVVAVLDTGVDATHPALLGRLLPGIDLVNDDAVPQDGPEPGQPHGPAEGHGTHVSGIVALVAPESKVLPVRVLDVDGRGDTFVLAYAIEWAVANGATVVNLSLGSDADATVLEEAIAWAQSQGALVTAAAGNEDAIVPQYPAAYPGVVAVTAVDEANHKADFANYGSGWIDLAAPGVAITSTIPVSGSILYATWSGTSMAVPFVSGAAALLRHQFPTAQPAQISAMLVQSGIDLDTLNPGYAGQLGRLVDISAAMQQTVLPTVESPVTPTVDPTVTPTITPTVAPTVTTPASPNSDSPTSGDVTTPTVTPTATPTVTPTPVDTPVGTPVDTPTDVPVDVPTDTPVNVPPEPTTAPVRPGEPTPVATPEPTLPPSDVPPTSTPVDGEGPLGPPNIFLPSLSK